MKFRILPSVALLACGLVHGMAMEVTFTSIPSSVPAGQNYYVEATADAGWWGAAIDITLKKNGNYVGTWHYVDEQHSTIDETTSDSSPQTVEYFAEAWELWYSDYNYAYAWVTITATPTTFSFSNLSHTYDGSSKTASVSPNPGGATYNADLTKGPGAGSYTVSATATGSYTGSGSDTLYINAASVSFSLSSTSFTYNGSAQGPSVVPSNGSATYSTGGTLSATNAGSYAASASAYGNYTGSNGSMGWSIAKASPAITFNPPSSLTYGDVYTLSASANSGGTISFSLISGSASLNFSDLTITGLTQVVVRASVAATGNYNAASTDRTITINQRSTTFALSATSFTYNGAAQGPSVVPTPGNATFSTGGTLSATNVGNYTGTATATGNFTGSNGSLGWSIAKANQTITFNQPASQTYGTPLSPGASSSSGLTVTYSVVSGPATVSGGTINFTGVGSVTVRASQAGDANFNAASNVDRTFNINKATPSTSFANRTLGMQTPTAYTVAAGDLNAVFTGPAGAPSAPTGTVTYAITAPSAASLAANTQLAAGIYTVRASYPGDANYNATTKDVEWTVTADSDNDTIPDYIEAQLGTDPNSSNNPDNDSSNQTKLKIHRPNQ